MKKVAAIILTLAVVIGMVLPALAVSAADARTIVIHKVILDGGPDEIFTFNVYRDFNNNGILDGGDVWVGDVVIDTAVTDTGSIMVPWLGPYMVHETLQSPSVYLQPADEAVRSVSHGATVYFYNKPGEVPERGQLEILKVDELGAALAGATFVITPDPKTGADSMTLVDNGLNDEDMTVGTLLVTDCIIGLEVTVAETVAPAGYVPAPPQTVTISATVTLTFINTPEDGDLGGTPGFWGSPAAKRLYGKTQLAEWFRAIVLDSDWFEDALASGNDNAVYGVMVGILKDKGAKNYDGAVNQFRSQYLATRLSALSGRLGLSTPHDISVIPDAEAYFGYASGTLSEIIATIESKSSGGIFTPLPERDDVITMKSVCDLLNNP